MDKEEFFYSRINQLPIEIINNIINFTDKIIYRHGKYMNRIDKHDYRYLLLKNIPRPIKIGPWKIQIKLFVYVNKLRY